MTERLANDLHAISNAILPRSWTTSGDTTTASTSCKTLASWTAEIELKHTQISTWLRTGRAPRSHDLRCYSNPKALLGALLQEAVQRHEGWTLDSAVLHTTVTDIDSPEALLTQVATASSSSSSSSGHSSAAGALYIHGLRIEGAAHFNGLMVEATSASTSLPLLCVTVVQAPVKPAATAIAAAVVATSSSKSTLHSCSVPLYTSAARGESSLVMSVQLQSKDRAASYWVLRGAAIVCSSD
jgi:Dynein heavy chain C-terminal domain